MPDSEPKRGRPWLQSVALAIALAPLGISLWGGGDDPITDLLLWIPIPCISALALILALVPIRRSHWKPVLGWLAAQALAAVVVYTGNVFTEGVELEGKIRAMTFNIEAGSKGDGKAIAAAIRRLNPDFVFLQEAQSLWPLGTLQEDLRAGLPGYSLRFDGQIGIASKYPIVGTTTVPLPESPAKRPLLEVDVLYKGDSPLKLMCAHLVAEHFGDFFSGEASKKEAMRARQIDAILDRVRRSKQPVLLGADLNMSPWHHQYRRLCEVMRDTTSGLFSRARFTVPAGFPLKRLDYILCSGGFDDATSWIPNEDLSDHEALVAEISYKWD